MEKNKVENTKMERTMNRREFFKLAGISSIASTLPASFNLFAAPADYNGKFLITVQAEGGWDVTSFCDPKMNVTGELEINHWARTAETQSVGNLSYAPFADNAAFFQKYYQDILIINGVDCQTNSHTAGVVHNWSGRIYQRAIPQLAHYSRVKMAPNCQLLTSTMVDTQKQAA